jgi:hypothetical protein
LIAIYVDDQNQATPPTPRRRLARRSSV